MRTFKPGDKVTWGGEDRVYEVWSKHRKPGWLWLTRDGKTIEARARNLTLVQAADLTPVPSDKPVANIRAKVTPLKAPAAKRMPKATDVDRINITAAIMGDAAAHDGIVNPNRVRVALTGPDGGLVVPAQALSGMYSALATRGVIRSLGWTDVNDDTRSGNAGRPLRTWQWVGPLPDAVAAS